MKVPHVALHFLIPKNSNTRNHITVCKQKISDSFKNNVTYRQFPYKSHIFNIYMYKEDLALNNI